MTDKSKPAETPAHEKSSKSTGTYVYDKKLGKVVKVSDDIPSLSKSHGHDHCSGPCCSGGGSMPSPCEGGGCGGEGCCG